MREYRICPWNGPVLEIAGRVFAPEKEPFCRLEYAPIDKYVWDERGYRPEARAYVGRTKDGLLVLMCAKEREIIARETRFGGRVCEDSCLEFFLNPCPSRGEDYINIEVNAAGVMHVGIGPGRGGRKLLEKMPEGVEVQHSLHEGAWWAVCYAIPEGLIRECFGGEMEKEMRGNFYKCDESIHPHYGSWNPVRADKPDFHRPECFGKICIED